MEVQISLKQEDLVAFLELAERQQQQRRSHRRYGAVLGVVLGVVLVTLKQSGLVPDAFVWPSIVGALGGIVFAVGIIVIFAVGVSARRKAMIAGYLQRFAAGPWKVRVSADGVNIDGPAFRSLHAWRDYTDIARTPTHLFLVVVPGVEALTIPRSTFTTPTEFEAFADLCEQLHLENVERVWPPSPDGITTVSDSRITNVSLKH